LAKILKPVLRVLEQLYRFPGAQRGAPEEVELGLGVTPVHDVSRMAEVANSLINRASAGYWLASVVQNHAGVGGLQENLNLITPPNAAEGYSMDESTQWAWVCGVWMTGDDPTDFASAQVLITLIGNDFFIGPHDTSPPASVSQIIYRSVALNGFTGTFIGIENLVYVNRPRVILSPQDGLRFESVSDTAGTVVITFNVLLWIGLRNTFPPGMF